jgi:formyltetrahydrofolate hydrolase
VEALTLKCNHNKGIVEELKEQLDNTKLRVLELEADLFFMSGDLHEKSLSEKNLKAKLDELSTRLKKANDTEHNRKAAA